ncbi:MAG: ABC transporter substrate-binding protein [Lachnospiraceae bacterium]|nr:ABC transporter substrate-binding protein [Lachnospiraceae bacterium]
MKKKSVTRIFSAVMVVAMSTALCACTGGSSGNSSSGNNSSDTPEFIFGMSQTITSVDPHEDTDAATRCVLFNVFEGLVKPTAEGVLVPAVASDYVISDDATEYTFTIREGITFHDGNPVTASDVKYSLERSAATASGSSALSSVSDISVPDDSTVVITIDSPNSEFIYNLTTAILEESNDAEQATNPIGTGPFMITEFEEGEYLDMAKYDGYWSELDCIDSCRFKFIDSATTAYTELESNAIDCLQYLTYEQAEALGDDYNIITTSMMLIHGLFLNNAAESCPALQDVRVRQALNYAIDRDEINDTLFAGESQLIQTHGYPRVAWYNSDTADTYTYDTVKAKELLKEAGYEDGFTFTIKVPKEYDQHVQTAEIISNQLSKIGVTAKLDKVEWTTWVSDVYKGRDYEATVVGFDAASLAPSTWYVRYYTTSGNDFTNFSNEEYDKIYDQAVASIDEDEKMELYGQLQQILAEEAASVFIEDPADFVALSADFTGYVSYPLSAIDLTTIKAAK